MPVGLVVAAVSAAVSISQAVKASNDRKKALEAIDNYDRQDIKNPYLGLDKYPMEAFAMRSEAADRELATYASVASRAGRGLALMPQAGDVYNQRQRQISGEIEKYQYERDKLIAAGESQKQNMLEARETADIAGLGNMYAVAGQDMNNAIVSTGNALAMGAEAYAGSGGFGQKSAAPQTTNPYLTPPQTQSQQVGVGQIQTNYNQVPSNPYANAYGNPYNPIGTPPQNQVGYVPQSVYANKYY